MKQPATLASLSTQPPIGATDRSRPDVAIPRRSRLRDHLGVLYRHRYLALTVLVFTVTAIVMAESATTHRYQATTRLSLESDTSQTGAAGTDRGSNALVDSQLVILGGRDLARRALEQIETRDVLEYKDAAASGDESARLDLFTRAIRVDRIGPSRLVNLSFTALDSQFALRAVNTLADHYVQQSGRATGVHVVDRAEVSRPIAAEISLWTWAVALSLGVVLAVAVPLTTDRLNGKVATPAHVVGELNLPCLGLVPSVRPDRHPPFASDAPRDFEAAFRTIGRRLIAHYSASGPKLLAVTSARPLEGKTVTAANIAMALARGGMRVLLVDSDMRQPGVHRLLRLPNERGLSQVLNGQARVRDVIQRSTDPNLLAIPAGKAPNNPAELLSSERMKTLMTTLADGTFDWVVIDTPPVLQVIDAVILAPSVTGFVYVARAEVTRRRMAERALKTLLAAGAGSVGVVLNKVDLVRHRLYYSNYFGHPYDNPQAQVEPSSY